MFEVAIVIFVKRVESRCFQPTDITYFQPEKQTLCPSALNNFIEFFHISISTFWCTVGLHCGVLSDVFFDKLQLTAFKGKLDLWKMCVSMPKDKHLYMMASR